MLVDLAAGREPDSVPLTGSLVESAVEHRMPGLLYTWAERQRRLTTHWGTTLTTLDGDVWARNRMLVSLAEGVVTTAEDIGLRVAVIKGVALEAQAYRRLGERPSGDIDLVLAPGSKHLVSDLVESLQPDHRSLHRLKGLVAGGHLQSIDLVIDGIPVDLHIDPLKLEVAASRRPELLWERLTTVTIEGVTLPTFDLDASLTLALLHLNKDRFSHLIGYADVVRLWRSATDWGWIESFAGEEGLRTALRETASAVVADLGLTGHEVPLSSTGASRIWRVLWPRRIRLSGAEGRVRWRYRQMFIPLLGPGRVGEVSAAWLKRIFPPRALLDIHYPETRGPYPWRLVSGRIIRRMKRIRRRRATTRRDQSSSEADPNDLRV
jgi:hypothetical protein